MKTKLITASLLAMASVASAQWTTSGSNIYNSNTGNVGIGTTNPIYKLDLSTLNAGGDGIRISNNGTNGEATLRMDNNTVGGHKYGLFVFGNGNAYPGAFDIYDYTSSSDRLFIGANGNVGINYTNPTYRMDINTNSNSDDGIRVTKSNAYAASLYLNNTNNSNPSMPGKNWAINSGPYGDFNIQNVNNGIDALHILPNGVVGVGGTAYAAKLQSHSFYNSQPGAIFSESWQTGSCFGVSGNALSSTNSGGTNALGIRGFASGAQTNYGGYFQGLPDCTVGVTTYGVYATVNNGVTLPCTNDLAGFFVGNVAINGNCTRTGTDNFTSDRKLKNNIKPLANTLEKIMQLKPSTYTFKTEEFKSMALPQGEQMGLIAQDLEQVFPQLVSEIASREILDHEGKVLSTMPDYKAVQYIGLIPVLIGGIQDQQKIISELKAQVTDLQLQVSKTTGVNTIDGSNGYAMYQNEPNPFSSETVIKYNLGNQVSSASLVVYDLTGKQLTSSPIEKGSSSITVTSEKLAAGIYIYSIIADGKVVDSKRMIVAEK